MLQHTFKSNFTTNFELSKAKSSKSHNFTAVYIHGLCSCPWGSKPEAIKALCEEQEMNFFRFELAGHGSDRRRRGGGKTFEKQ